MTARLEYWTKIPEAVQALRSLNHYVDGSTVAPILRYLLEVRVSQINGCSYCIGVHWRQALDVGEREARLQALETWRDSDLFTESERVALAWAEDITLVSETHAPQASYDALLPHYNERELVDLTFVVLSMNAWNRLAIAFRHETPRKGA